MFVIARDSSDQVNALLYSRRGLLAGKQEQPGTHHDFNNPYLVNVLIAHGHRPCRWMVTLHRRSNVDSAAMMGRIGGALKEIAVEPPLIFPGHPRTRGNLEKFGIDPGPNIALVGPQAYMAFLNLWKDAAVVLTCPIPPPSRGRLGGGYGPKLRNMPHPHPGPPIANVAFATFPLKEREKCAAALRLALIGNQGEVRIVAEARKLLRGEGRQGRRPHLWDGKAAERIVAVLAGELGRK